MIKCGYCVKHTTKSVFVEWPYTNETLRFTWVQVSEAVQSQALKV